MSFAFFKHRYFSWAGAILCAVYAAFTAICLVSALSDSSASEISGIVFLFPVVFLVDLWGINAGDSSLPFYYAASVLVTAILLYGVGFAVGKIAKWIFSGFLKGRSRL